VNFYAISKKNIRLRKKEEKKFERSSQNSFQAVQNEEKVDEGEETGENGDATKAFELKFEDFEV